MEERRHALGEKIVKNSSRKRELCFVRMNFVSRGYINIQVYYFLGVRLCMIVPMWI